MLLSNRLAVMKLVSIIIPCYNVEQYISQCLDSVVGQTYTNLQIICVDDGSTDKTRQILNNFAAKDYRIRIVIQNNAGLSAARNIGIQNSVGDFLMFVDADDWIDKNAVQITIEKPRVDLICFSYKRIFHNRVEPRKLNLSGDFEASYIQRRMVGLVGEELRDPSQTDSIVTAWGKLYDTTLIKKNIVQFVDTKIIGTEDALFNIQYLEFAKSVTILDIPIYNYRKTNINSLTNTHKPELFERWQVLYAKIGESIKTKNKDFSLALNNRICLSLIGLGLNETFSDKTDKAKRSKLLEIISDPLYRKAFSNLNLKYFPLYWMVFFFFAKKRNSYMLLVMLQIMNFMINRKN